MVSNVLPHPRPSGEIAFVIWWLWHEKKARQEKGTPPSLKRKLRREERERNEKRKKIMGKLSRLVFFWRKEEEHTHTRTVSITSTSSLGYEKGSRINRGETPPGTRQRSRSPGGRGEGSSRQGTPTPTPPGSIGPSLSGSRGRPSSGRLRRDALREVGERIENEGREREGRYRERTPEDTDMRTLALERSLGLSAS